MKQWWATDIIGAAVRWVFAFVSNFKTNASVLFLEFSTAIIKKCHDSWTFLEMLLFFPLFTIQPFINCVCSVFIYIQVTQSICKQIFTLLSFFKSKATNKPWNNIIMFRDWCGYCTWWLKHENRQTEWKLGQGNYLYQLLKPMTFQNNPSKTLAG